MVSVPLLSVPLILALISLGGALLALLGCDVGVGILGFVAGSLAGWAVAYFLTKPRRYRIWAYAGLGLVILLPFAVSIFGLARGIDWLLVDLGLDSVLGSFWFGFALGAIQVIFGRSSGCGFWSEDRTRDGN